jgi:electron transport complex protein RnfA
MSIFGLAFYFALAGNMLVQWGLVPPRKAPRKATPAFIVIFLVASALAATVDGLMFRFVLTPLGLESLSPVVFVLLLFSAYLAFRAILSVTGNADTFHYDEHSFQLTLVLYAVAMMAGGRFSSVWLLMGGGAAAAFGYLAATRFLDDIMDRLDLEPVPAPFRGAPIRFISAGLMALAFAGVDAGFFSKFPG